jgi:hypothetical protein
MKFILTPEEAQGAALAVATYLRNLGMKIKCEVQAWPGAPYRTTLVATKSEFHLLIEAQGTLSYGKALKELTTWLAANRHYAEFYLTTTSEAVLQAGMLAEMKKGGVGLFVIDDHGQVSEPQRARNPALVVTPDPTLRFGECKQEIANAVKKFNDVDRKDGLRDMCETVERKTEELAIRAVRKGWLVLNEQAILDKDWSSQIDTLASKHAYNVGKDPIVTPTFKNDLHSFRGARNLVDHMVRGKRDDANRQKQFAERMMQGPRLVAELMSLQRKVR